MDCEFRDRCYCKLQKKSGVVRISVKAIETAERRERVEARREENTSKRAAIEGTHSALKRGHGLDKLRVRGIHRCSAVVGLKVTAQNIKRFIRYMLGGYERAKPKGGDRGILVPVSG